VNIEQKRNLLGQLIRHIEADIAAMRNAALDAAEAATHEEAKPENDKDTRALEASYLAAGQAERVRELEHALKVLHHLDVVALGADSPICSTAFVTLDDAETDGDGEHESAHFFVAPHGGGIALTLGDEAPRIQVVTPQSPLGRALIGRTQGETIEVRGKSKMREWHIARVA
jgi:hypothetical protein